MCPSICIVFFISLADFNVPSEKQNYTVLHNSFELFSNSVNNIAKDNPVILLMTKYDIFSEKLKYINLKDFFPEFSGLNTAEEGFSFFRKKFISLCQHRKRPFHIISANLLAQDEAKTCVKIVFNISRRIQVRNSME